MKAIVFKSPINGALIALAVSHPGVNAWARENIAMRIGDPFFQFYLVNPVNPVY